MRPVFGVSETRSDTNRAVLPQKMPKGLHFGFRKKRDCAIHVAKNKDADQLCARLPRS